MVRPTEVLKAWEACDRTDTLFVLVGIAYSGYTTRSNSLAAVMPAILAVIVCSIQWFLIGYTLTYGEGGAVFGDFKYAFHRNVLAEPVGTIPAVLFSFFQLVFQATVCAIAVGGACERGRILPLIPFIFLWSTFIYNPLAHMVWGGGFLMDLGVVDFAGGTPVHINSGATATAMSVYLSYPLFRSRKSSIRTPSHLVIHRPVNSLCQLLAMISIWGSWLAFDAGTTLAFNFKSVMALCVTNLCAASGAMTWMLYTYVEVGRWSLDSCFMGAISGLIMITPSAGFIDLPTALFFGIVGALVCRQALRIKLTGLARRWRWVDHGDTFATHCLGGILATIATGCFAQKEVAGYDGVTEILGIQIVEASVGFCWSFVGSYTIYALIDCIPGFEVLAEDKDVIAGLDASQMDEETLWTETQKYYPYADREGELHLD
ncbi:ammonium transporter AmtB-like domain-containing protein [Phaeosphaeria sp. MPI-PUGE-AT-0046c]|nr:ammonium transporter AmtB-like domain-containing protein [Phaeosphaeria sp. MPI-PUGE-AT-0046c]